MRKRVRSGDLSVHAVAGTYVTLLGLDIAEGSPMLDGLLGFGIWRRNHTESKEGWLPGMKRFRSDAEAPHPSRLTSTRTNPMQGFMWSDYAAKAGHDYTCSTKRSSRRGCAPTSARRS